MRERIYSDKSQDLCYGCRACEQICPKNAVTMKQNEEGFTYPYIENERCIECGMCEKVCPTREENMIKILHPEQSQVYAAWNKKIEERLLSTSGGLFYILARQFLKDGGVVYGAAYDNNLTVCHIKVSTLEELKTLRGSKYVQSDTNSTYKQVRDDLERGVRVLYSGTPCQIAGLRSFLIKNYDNLITIDLVCHGTPSPAFFASYLHYIKHVTGQQVKSFLFRSKKLSGWRAYVSYRLSNNKLIYRKIGEDFFTYNFNKGNINRLSCYMCEFSQVQRVGDITLSDFWGAENYVRELKYQRKYGFNMVMCNSNKGIELFEKIKDKIGFVICKTTIAINGDIRLRHAEEKPEVRNKIYREYREYGFDYVYQNYSPKLNKIKRILPDFIVNLLREMKSRI